MENIITFDEKSKAFILDIFQKTVNAEGLIVEKNNSEERVFTPAREEVSLKEFAGVQIGSEIFIKSDLPSLIDLVDRLK